MISTRLAREEDLPELRRLWALGEAEHLEPPEPFRGGSEENLVQLLGETSLLAAEADGVLCGFVGFLLRASVYSGVNIVVDPAYRRRGVAHELLKAAHRIAAQRGATRALTALWKGSDLLPLYESLGYKASAHLLMKEL